MINTIMTKLAPGSHFGFGHHNPRARFEKISNLYARDLVDGSVSINVPLTVACMAGNVKVTYHPKPQATKTVASERPHDEPKNPDS